MENNWQKPEIEDLGSAREIIKSQDIDGSGDNFAPINLASV